MLHVIAGALALAIGCAHAPFEVPRLDPATPAAALHTPQPTPASARLLEVVEEELPAIGSVTTEPRDAWLVGELAKRGSRLAASHHAAVLDALLAAERDHGLDPVLLLALIAQESSFDPKARGVSGSLGLMQVQPTTGRAVARELGIPWKGEATLFDPAKNVRLGAAYLGSMMRRFGDLDLALAAYNLGPGRVSALRAATPRAPRSVYSKEVHARYEALRQSGSLLIDQ